MNTNVEISAGREARDFRRLFCKANIHLFFLLALFGTSLALAACGGTSEKSVASDQPGAAASVDQKGGLFSRLIGHTSPIRIPSGTAIEVRLLNSISSHSVSPGEEFDAELAAPINDNDTIVFSRGTRVRGRVVSSRSSGRLHHPGFLRLTLDSIQTPAGQWMPISTTSVSASGKSHKKRNLVLIGGGTGLGGLIGALAGGGQGLAIGAASGAAAGTAGAFATGKKDVVFSAETRFTFRTTDEIVMNP